MNLIVFLIFWVPGKQIPTAAFMSSYDTVKECNEVIEKVRPEIRKSLTCLQVNAEPLKDAVPI